MLAPDPHVRARLSHCWRNLSSEESKHSPPVRVGGPISVGMAKHYHHTIRGSLGLDTAILSDVAKLNAKPGSVAFYDSEPQFKIACGTPSLRHHVSGVRIGT